MGYRMEMRFDRPVGTVAETLLDLLSEASVEVERSDDGARSTGIPFFMQRWDDRRYSSRNWIGLNPFIQLSGIALRWEAVGASHTRVHVELDHTRAYLSAAFLGIASVVMMRMAGRSTVVEWGLAAAFTAVTWFCLVPLNHYMVRQEIQGALG